jgi:hypothetical protein
LVPEGLRSGSRRGATSARGKRAVLAEVRRAQRIRRAKGEGPRAKGQGPRAKASGGRREAVYGVCACCRLDQAPCMLSRSSRASPLPHGSRPGQSAFPVVGASLLANRTSDAPEPSIRWTGLRRMRMPAGSGGPVPCARMRRNRARRRIVPAPNADPRRTIPHYALSPPAALCAIRDSAWTRQPLPARALFAPWRERLLR